MGLLPLKMAVLVTISANSNVTLNTIMEILKDDYGNEKQFNEKNFSHLLHALKAVGLIERCGIIVSEQNEVCEQYKITEAGMNYVKSFPQNH